LIAAPSGPRQRLVVRLAPDALDIVIVLAYGDIAADADGDTVILFESDEVLALLIQQVVRHIRR
jgi:hypothetical protein